jgi:hypothetical protein
LMTFRSFSVISRESCDPSITTFDKDSLKKRYEWLLKMTFNNNPRYNLANLHLRFF